MFKYSTLILVINSFLSSNIDASSDQIIGKWASADNNLIVDVFKENNAFKAKIIWFNDSDDKSKPMNSRLDEHNPDPSLRKFRILGMEVLKNLNYNPNNNRWEDGIIYDAQNGRIWSAYLYVDQNGFLKVRGYWHLKFIGQTLTFTRVNN